MEAMTLVPMVVAAAFAVKNFEVQQKVITMEVMKPVPQVVAAAFAVKDFEFQERALK